jgi:hypothetical protein
MTRLIAAAVLSVAVLGFNAGRVVAEPGDATEKVLKDSKLDYKKLKEGVFKVIVETKEGISSMVIIEQKAGWADAKKNDVLQIVIYTQVLTTPADFKPPVGMLTKLAEANDQVRFGSLLLVKNKDGSHVMYYKAMVFLKNLDGDQLADHVYIAHGDRFFFQKEFKGFLDGQ